MFIIYFCIFFVVCCFLYTLSLKQSVANSCQVKQTNRFVRFMQFQYYRLEFSNAFFFWIIKLLSFAFTVLCKHFALKLLISFIFNVFNFFCSIHLFSQPNVQIVFSFAFFILFFTKDLRKLMMSFSKLIY